MAKMQDKKNKVYFKRVDNELSLVDIVLGKLGDNMTLNFSIPFVNTSAKYLEDMFKVICERHNIDYEKSHLYGPNYLLYDIVGGKFFFSDLCTSSNKGNKKESFLDFGVKSTKNDIEKYGEDFVIDKLIDYCNSMSSVLYDYGLDSDKLVESIASLTVEDMVKNGKEIVLCEASESKSAGNNMPNNISDKFDNKMPGKSSVLKGPSENNILIDEFKNMKKKDMDYMNEFIDYYKLFLNTFKGEAAAKAFQEIVDKGYGLNKKEGAPVKKDRESNDNEHNNRPDMLDSQTKYRFKDRNRYRFKDKTALIGDLKYAIRNKWFDIHGFPPAFVSKTRELIGFIDRKVDNYLSIRRNNKIHYDNAKDRKYLNIVDKCDKRLGLCMADKQLLMDQIKKAEKQGESG